LTAILAVRSTEFQALVRGVPFVALPREEIDRLHGAIEVLAVDHDTLGREADLLALDSYIAIHHNYSWLTFPRRDGRRTLLLSAVLSTDGPAPLFLGEEFVVSAGREVERRLALNAACEVRLAGILQETGGTRPSPRVGLLSIARLSGRLPGYEGERCGNVELRQARSQFDSCSQVVIDHLEAL
jgi:hypothetical protein